MKKIIIAISAFFVLTTGAMAQATNFSGVYLGAIGGYTSYNFDGLNDSIGGTTFGGVVGYRAPVTDNIVAGVEGFVTFGQANKDFVVLAQTVNVNADESYGFNGTLGFVVDQALVYALLGYGWTGFTAADTIGLGLTSSDSEGGVRAGGGVEFKISEEMAVRVQGEWQDFSGANSVSGIAGLIFSF